jgi:parallel beta-helix repeat protein
MAGISTLRLTRRGFLGSLSAASAACGLRARAAEPPPVSHPRATSGDAVEPNWSQRLSLTVGRARADLVGADHRVFQAAVDYLAALGGGTVHVLPGVYRLRNAVYLRSKVRIVGSGPETILVKEPSTTTRLAADSDWYDQEITLVDAKGFELGDGVCLQARNPHNGGTNVCKRTLVARSGNRFKLNRALRENFWLRGETKVSTLFPLLSGEEISQVTVENLTLDGAREHNEPLNGNYGGCIFCQDCDHLAFRNLVVRNSHGDGISWQICHDVLVEGCHSHDNADLGLHPGSGSQRPVVRNNRLERNSIGLFFCWGVKYGLAEGNTIDDSRDYGISVGHRDTDNRIENNTVRRSGKVGVLFRIDGDRPFAPHRNQLLHNRIHDSGPDDGVAVDVQGEVEGLVISGNEIVETRGPQRRIGIRIAQQARDIRLADNRVRGCAVEVADLRKR